MDDQKKLELTLCGMLPYGLKAEVRNWGTEQKTFIVKCIGIIGNEVIVESPYGGHDYTDFEDFKPVLHSLDKLTEPILDGGLIPIVELAKISDLNKDTHELRYENNLFVLYNKDGYYQINDNNFYFIEKLKEWHFNIYDLPKEMYIEKSESNEK